MTVRNNINMESVEKALDSLKEHFKEVIQENEALTKEVEKLRAIEKERKEAKLKELEAQIEELKQDKIKKLKANIEYIELGNKANRILATMVPPASIYQSQIMNAASPRPLSPIDIMIEQERRNLYG